MQSQKNSSSYMLRGKRRLPEIPLYIGRHVADKALSPIQYGRNTDNTETQLHGGTDWEDSRLSNDSHSSVITVDEKMPQKHVNHRESTNENTPSEEKENLHLHDQQCIIPANFVKQGNEGVMSDVILNGDDHVGVFFDTTSDTCKAYLDSDNFLLQQNASTEKELPANAMAADRNTVDDHQHSDADTMFVSHLDYDATHRGVHKFIPRHDDEVAIEIGDPVYVEEEDDDLWCRGVNLRTGERGIFPSVYATDLGVLAEEMGAGDKKESFELHFLGSVEVNYHKGTEVLCQAINKVVLTRRMTLHTSLPALFVLEITDYGVRMLPKNSERKHSIKKKLGKIFSKKDQISSDCSHFFSMKNISFCGHHPRDEKYFAFITKHPLEMRFACHVFLGEESTKPVSYAIGGAFKKFYNEYMAFAHPTEDIYLE